MVKLVTTDKLNASKMLSTCLLVSSKLFAKKSATQQTETLASAAGKPIIFVDTFTSLRDKKKLVERLLKGEDVSMELEFNEIELSDDDKMVLDAVRPILERITASYDSGYEWSFTGDAKAYLRKAGWIVDESSVMNPNGYNITKMQSERVWNLASGYWAGGERPESRDMTIGGSGTSRRVSINPKSVAIGCQRISKETVEAVALHFGFEPNI